VDRHRRHRALPLAPSPGWASTSRSATSRARGRLEISPNAGGLARYPIKTLIVVAFALLIVQGVSQIIKHAAFLRGRPGSGSHLRERPAPRPTRRPRPPGAPRPPPEGAPDARPGDVRRRDRPAADRLPGRLQLGGTAVLFTLIGSRPHQRVLGLDLPWAAEFRLARLNILPQRIFGTIMDNYTLVAVPFFVFMGVMLEKSGLAEELLETMGMLFGTLRGGLAISVVAVGALLAASTGVVGASVVTMGVLALPVMLKYGYAKPLATGVIASSGTLGQIIPPSIVLVILGRPDRRVGRRPLPGRRGARRHAGRAVHGVGRHRGPDAARTRRRRCPPEARTLHGWRLGLAVLKNLVPPLVLIFLVLGTIFLGIATPTEAGAMGAIGAMALAAINRRLTFVNLKATMDQTVRLTSMVFIILTGATAFGMVFTALHGDRVVQDFLLNLPGGQLGFLVFSMLVIFLLGFFIDFIEITFVVVPLLAPIALAFFGPG
jgi:TRAP-type mannitol/chloroaromatic compound transport system permease large subunit